MTIENLIDSLKTVIKNNISTCSKAVIEYLDSRPEVERKSKRFNNYGGSSSELSCMIFKFNGVKYNLTKYISYNNDFTERIYKFKLSDLDYYHKTRNFKKYNVAEVSVKLPEKTVKKLREKEKANWEAFWRN